MSPIQIYYKLFSEKDRIVYDEVKLRKLCMYIVAQNWDKKNGALYPWKLWAIPEIDDRIADSIGYARVRKWSPERAKEYGLPENWGE